MHLKLNAIKNKKQAVWQYYKVERAVEDIQVELRFPVLR